ncbi:AAA family ATPase [Vibrio diabolicus]|uniref:AAA family ATPase n=1 Tax=Vibrio diabolicus TaxID=50719 RepID=UPI00215ECBA6|nr:ATP-binding protein [Vibrio diabolicus]MCS0311143.1 ATP-binding protein [Vibrio diabolicus]
MLIRFGVCNHKSIREPIELNLSPSADVRRFKHHIHKFQPDSFSALRGSVIYGANASGKSNLCDAINFGKVLIKGNPPKLRNIVNPFNSSKDSIFEYELEKDGIFYLFGFSLNSKRITEEWLYLSRDSKDSEDDNILVYSTKYNDGNLEFSFNKELLDNVNEKDFMYLEFISRSKDKEKLFISEYLDKSEAYFTNSLFDFCLYDVSNWFYDNLSVISPNSKYLDFDGDVIHDEKCKHFYLTFLKAFDTGISDITELVLKESDLPKPVLDNVKRFIDDEFEGEPFGFTSRYNDTAYFLTVDSEANIEKISEVCFSNDNSSCEKSIFKRADLSDGTKRLIDIVPALYEAIYSNSTIIVDEIDRSLHPIITKLIVEFFYDERIKPLGQFIVTTHDTGLMDQTFLRQDEIWFVQKERDCSSIVYSLEEYERVRPDKALDKDYLNGRFGAVVNYTSAKLKLEELKNVTAIKEK